MVRGNAKSGKRRRRHATKLLSHESLKLLLNGPRAQKENIRDVIYFIFWRNGDRSLLLQSAENSAQLGISLTSMVTFAHKMCSLIERSQCQFMCPLETCVIIHIERGMIFKNYFSSLWALNVQLNLQPSAPSVRFFPLCHRLSGQK